MPGSELSCSSPSYCPHGGRPQYQAPLFSFSSNSGLFVSGGLFLEGSVSTFLLRSVSSPEEPCPASVGVSGPVCRPRAVAGGRFCSVSLRSDGIVREAKRSLVQSGYEGSEGAVVEETKKERIRVRGKAAMNTTKHLWAGAIAAMVSRTFVAPLERLKLEYIVRGEQKNLYELVRTIAASQGLRGFWKGNLVNILRTAPFKAVNFYAYDTYRKQLLKFSGNEETTNFERFIAGAAAGMTATILCLPLDTVLPSAAISYFVYEFMKIVLKVE